MRGITLMELLVVISIIAIVSMIASLNAASWIRESRVNEARDLLITDIENVKLKSMTDVPHAIIVSGGAAAAYTVNRLTDADSDFVRDGSEALTIVRTETLADKVKISLTGGAELWFDRKGVPRTSGWTMPGRTFTVWYDANGNNADDGGEPKREITISSRGRIQYEK